MVIKQLLDDIGVSDLSEEDGKRLTLIREAIQKKGRLQIRYKRLLRTIFVHRVWLQDDGSILSEAFQQAGGSVWGGGGGEGPGGGGGGNGFSPSPLGGWQGWIFIEFEKIESIEPIRGTFTTRRDFNPNPVKRPGKIIWQVAD